MDTLLIIKFFLGVAIGGVIGAYVGRNQVYNKLFLRNLAGDEDGPKHKMSKGERFRGNVLGVSVLAIGIIGAYNVIQILNRGIGDDLISLIMSIGMSLGCSVLGLMSIIRSNGKNN